MTLLYTIVRFWLAKVAPFAIIGLIFGLFYPGVLRSLRRFRRRAWASRRGFRERIGVAYAELRDDAIDLNIGHPSLTPIEFLDVLVEDDDHTQLAWLVTRGVWGDLSRDLRVEDAEQAEVLARSVRKRLTQAQSPLVRVLVFASRASLRDPYVSEIPNLWVDLRLGSRLAKLLRTPWRAWRGWRRRTRVSKATAPAEVAS